MTLGSVNQRSITHQSVGQSVMNLERVRYAVCKVSTEPIEGSHRISHPCQYDTGVYQHISSLEGVDKYRTLWLMSITGQEFVWTRGYNRRFRWHHLIKDHTNYFDATVLLDPIRCEYAMYSSTVAQKYIVPYLASLPTEPPLDKDPEYATRLKQFTDIFRTCAEQPGTVVLIS